MERVEEILEVAQIVNEAADRLVAVLQRSSRTYERTGVHMHRTNGDFIVRPDRAPCGDRQVVGP
jgi:hypothetical protein